MSQADKTEVPVTIPASRGNSNTVPRRAILKIAVAAFASGGPAGAMTAAHKPAAMRLLSHRLAAGPFVNRPANAITVATLDNLAAEPALIRFVHFNSLPAPYIIDRAAVALSASVHDGLTPVDATGVPDPGSWREVSYSAPGTNPAAGDATNLSVTVPAHYGPPGQPGMIFSDWIALPPRPRMDGGPGALLLARVYAAGTQPLIPAGVPDVAIGRNYAATLAGLDGAAPPWSLGWRRPGFTGGYAVQYISRTSGVTVIAIGDSITASARTSGHISGHVYRASVMLSAPSQPVEFFNEAVSGRRSVDFVGNGRRQIASLRPQFGVLQCWSENDGPSHAAAAAALDRSLALAA